LLPPGLGIEIDNMLHKSVAMWIVLVSAIGVAGCSGSSGNDSSSPPPSGGEPPPSPPPPPPPPPGGGFQAIPAVPFDYLLPVGNATTSGSLPATLSAGEVLGFTGQTVSEDLSMTCAGTETNPAFVVGGTLTGSDDKFTISGSWCFFVDTEFNNIQPHAENADHVVFRNINVHDITGKNGLSLGGTNIVLTDSEIHHNQGDDRHGVFVGPGSDGVWILGNHVHHNGGDGFQACHQCSANPPRNVYIGDNTFNSDRENGIDFKFIEDVIVEGNLVHSLVASPPGQEFCFDDGSGCGIFSSGSDGSGIVIGSDGGPTNVLLIDNEIHSTVNAVRLEEGIAISIEENNFHDLSDECFALDKEGFDTVFAGNSCSNASRGIFQNFRVNFSLFVEGNLFENLSGPAIEYEARSVCDASTLVDNTFSSTGAVICGNDTATTEAEINDLPNASGNVVN
jgi:hypothetical protein